MRAPVVTNTGNIGVINLGLGGDWRYNRFIMKEFLQELIRAETTAEAGEAAAAEIIAQRFDEAGIVSSINRWGENRANIVARIESGRRKPAIIFACHLDVVPAGHSKWRYPPFSATEEAGRIYGRGSADMKAGIAAIVTAITQLAEGGIEPGGDIIFAATAGEETDSCGAVRFVDDYAGRLGDLAGIVIPEPTDFEIVTAHRGIFWLEVSTAGMTAHGSMPQLGVNAISSMKRVLDELMDYKIDCDEHELLGPASMSINTIAGGKAVNVVPDHCSVGIDIRTLPGQNYRQIIDDIRGIFAELKQKYPDFEAEVSILRELPALETDTECDFVRGVCSVCGIDKTWAVGFTTDGSCFARLDAPVVIFGPGKPDLCHKPDEYVELADVEKAVDYYKKIILKFLG